MSHHCCLMLKPFLIHTPTIEQHKNKTLHKQFQVHHHLFPSPHTTACIENSVSPRCQSSTSSSRRQRGQNESYFVSESARFGQDVRKAFKTHLLAPPSRRLQTHQEESTLCKFLLGEWKRIRWGGWVSGREKLVFNWKLQLFVYAASEVFGIKALTMEMFSAENVCCKKNFYVQAISFQLTKRKLENYFSFKATGFWQKLIQLCKNLSLMFALLWAGVILLIFYRKLS